MEEQKQQRIDQDNHEELNVSYEYKTHYFACLCLLRQRTPPRMILDALFNKITVDSTDLDIVACQKALMYCLRHEPSVDIAPYSNKYVSRLLCALMDYVSRNVYIKTQKHWELCECVADELIQVTTCINSDNDGWGYKVYTYSICSNEYYSSQCSCTNGSFEIGARSDYFAMLLSDNLFEGSTGCHEWDASFFLCEVLYNTFACQSAGSKILDFEKSTIVELGCGSGLVGMFLVREMHVKGLLLTDGDENSIDNAVRNINRNFQHCDVFAEHINLAKDSHILHTNFLNCHSKDDVTIMCGVHDWQDDVACDLRGIADIVLCSDVIYDPQTIEPLVKTIASFLKKRNSSVSVKAPSCFICNALRTQSSLDTLEKIAKDYGFEVDVFSIQTGTTSHYYDFDGLANTDHQSRFIYHKLFDRNAMRLHTLTLANEI